MRLVTWSYELTLRRTLPVCVLVLAASNSAAQQDLVPDPALQRTKQEIANVNGTIRSLLAELTGASPDVVEGRLAEIDKVISQVPSIVDTYIASAVNVGSDSRQIGQALEQLLPNADEPPATALVFDAASTRYLITAYTLHKGGLMGVRATSVVFRAYKGVNSRFHPVATTGGDMAGYQDIVVRELHSPVENEVWLLVSGQMSGANGPNIRMRIYVFDGSTFRTVWMPENAWGDFKIKVDQSGFTIDGSYYRESTTRNDRYFLSPDGVYRGRPEQGL